MSNPQESKLYSATLLIRGMEGLSLGGAVSVPPKAIEDAGVRSRPHSLCRYGTMRSRALSYMQS